MKGHISYSQKPAEITRRWYLVDASKAPLGRLASAISRTLIGKSKTTYTPHVDNGDYVVVINAKHAVVTGNKEQSKKYYNYSGYVGGLKSLSLAEVRSTNPERIIIDAVKGMLPKNKLSDQRLKRLKVFLSTDHKHAAQNPTEIEVS